MHGTGQACGGEMEGGEGEGRTGAMGMRWQSQLINTWVWLLEVREVTHSCDFIKKGGSQGSY